MATLISLLRRHHVDVVVDVRLTPISWKKGFSKNALAASLNAAGIDYVHVSQLGNPKANRVNFHNGQQALGRKVYLHRLNHDSRVQYDDLLQLARTRRVALLCVENDDRECHRSCITDQAGSENPPFAVVNV